MIYSNEAANGSIDLDDLEMKLKSYENDKRVKIGTFCATSNITGIIAEIDKITILLHKYGFLAFWDFATAAGYLDINMNPFVKTEGYLSLLIGYKPALLGLNLKLYFFLKN
jgi:selenocysteine lyase/cysteine desulfurase